MGSTTATKPLFSEEVAPDIRPDVVYVPDFLTQEEADDLLSRIKSEAHFHQNYIQLFGTKAVPRLEAWYGPWDYAYSKGVILKAAPAPDYLQAMMRRLKEEGFGQYDAVLINRYRDGNDHIAWHSDDDFGDPEPDIASITVGTPRPFRLRLRADKARLVEYLPQHGSLLVMRGRTNRAWEHSVPKTAKQIGERINLTFRFKPII
jgi:alkylated DNA repair dioxygenase AlkB